MTKSSYDVIVVGAGTSGLTVARELATGGLRTLVVEAGARFDRRSYPTTEVAGSSQLFWGGGVELTKDAGLAILRPRVVGGGSVVNQALMDRFDDDAWSCFRAASGVDFLAVDQMAPWYDEAERRMSLQTVPENQANGNAAIFRDGFARNGYQCAPLRRAQRDCRFEDGNSCIACLSGCRIDSKQSTALTALPDAEEHGAQLRTRAEVTHIDERADHVAVTAVDARGGADSWRAQRVVLASGAIGNTKLLLTSGYGRRLAALGAGFYTHPQFMNFGIFDDPVEAWTGPLQNYKSADPGFRRQGFKLENVFAGPASIAMLLPGYGRRHMSLMRQFNSLGCIEVCIRDTNPGRIRLSRKGSLVIDKRLNAEDLRRKEAGACAIRNIFHAMGAREQVDGEIGIGLHLMGGCAIGTDPRRSVVSPGFTIHGSRRLYAADSSIFPDAPGINPALSIMALSLRASRQILEDAR